MMIDYIPFIIALVVVALILWRVGVFSITDKPKYKISSVVLERKVPSFYGLRGFKTEQLIITDPAQIIDWQIGVFNPDGYTHVCSNHKLIEANDA